MRVNEWGQIKIIKLVPGHKTTPNLQPSPPIIGKTYSLFGEGKDTRAFFTAISSLADELTVHLSFSEKQLLDYLQSVSGNRRKLRKATGQHPGDPMPGYILSRGNELLSDYLGNVEQHIRSVHIQKHFTDREILTSREQYILYMIESELVNRVHIEHFRQSNFRIALLPYCLKESHATCKATRDEIDYRCMGCIKTCLINRTSSILSDHNIHPYILSRGRVGGLLKELHTRHGSIGVLGIACIVELVMGMRLCMKAGLPVVGVPLNANRCPRWMGEMQDTSVNLEAVEKLVGC